jgi:hypothetical protein
VVIVCANDHRKLTDMQLDQIAPGQAPAEGQAARIGHYLLGLADLYAMTAATLRKFGAPLIAEAPHDE